MCWWGAALVLGPHVNGGMDPANDPLAWSRLQRALALAPGATQREQEFIRALAARYAEHPPQDRRSLDEAYARSMGLLVQARPADLDAAVLYAEALMDLQPWDMWTNDGQPKGRTTEVVEVLRKVLAKHPSHPGASHLYIHAVEASPNPADALAAADSLRDLVPISGHLQHMPSHIDARVGQWLAAVEANRKAIAAEKEYRRLSPRQDYYMSYMQHNHGFLSFACMMLGRSAEAIAAGRDAVTMLPAEWVRENAAVIDGYLTVHMDALKRFGRWDDILALPAPPDYLPFTTSM
jgi:tetratricopeptide (TPR) repeat protein